MSRPLTELYPASMVENREPQLIEPAYGVAEKTGEKVRIYSPTLVREKAVIHTHEWLAPVLYRYDSETGALVILDILRPSPQASYTLETVGGERIRKHVEVGLIYVLTRPTSVVVNEPCSGIVKEKLRAGLTLSEVRLQVKDVAKLLLELWRRHGTVNTDNMFRELKRLFRRTCQRTLPETSIEDLLTKPDHTENTIAESLRELLASYGIELRELDVKPLVSDESYEYYFWHIVNELPPDYTYLLRLLSRMPTQVYEHAPSTIDLVTASIIGRRNPKIVELLAFILHREEGEE